MIDRRQRVYKYKTEIALSLFPWSLTEYILKCRNKGLCRKFSIQLLRNIGGAMLQVPQTNRGMS